MVALEYQTGHASADGDADDILHVREAKTVAGNLGLVDLDLQKRQARHFFHLDAGRALNGLEDGGDLIGGAYHRRELVAEYLDCQILAHAGDQFVEAHLDWLGKTKLVARQLRCLRFNLADQVILGEVGVWPFVLGLYDDVGIGGAWWHRVRGQIRRAGTREHERDLRKATDQVFIRKLHGL